MDKRRLIIIGGGFAGVACAGELTRLLRREAEPTEIVLFSRQNHLVFSPLLAEVVGSSIDALDCVVPLRQVLEGVYCRMEEVKQIDLASRTIEFEAPAGGRARLGFEHLVIACGNATDLNVVPGMVDHSFPLKTVHDAAALRAHIMEQMELAEVADDPANRRWHLTFIVVGGGYSGVEAAGEINDLVRDSARYFQRWRAEESRVILLHSREQILPEISPGLREFARRKMEKSGVTIRLNSRVSEVTAEGVALESGEQIKGGTTVCTIGSAPAPLVARLEAPKEKGRLLTEPDMRLRGQSNAWAIGDCAWTMNARANQPSPTTGQFAERQGRQCARNIARVLHGQTPRAFAYKPIGELCSIGGHSAVADLMGIQLSGFLAWFVWRGVYLFKLPTIGRRLQVGFDWAWLLAFPRDLAYVRTEQTDRVTHAHYAPGDLIIKQGDPPTNFYVLEKGEVEIVRPRDGSAGEVVNVLGAGSFFGERALMNNRPRVMSVRARTPVEVLVMGKNVFTQVSTSLAPLKDALAQTLNRRLHDTWKDRPEVYAKLRSKPVAELMDPAPTPFLEPTATLQQVARAFVERADEFFYVTSQGDTLEGVVTISDLVRSHSGLPFTAQTPIAELMTRDPITVAAEDDSALAADVLREYRLKTLPVVACRGSRRVVGALRMRKLIGFALRSDEAGSVAAPTRAAA